MIKYNFNVYTSPNFFCPVHPELIDRCDLKQRTPLFLAVENDQVASVECLLDWGADPNIGNKDRETPLYKGTTSA